MKPLAPCGTRAAAARHRRRGEPLDDACRAAHNAWEKARQRALMRLAGDDPDKYRAYLKEELERA